WFLRIREISDASHATMKNLDESYLHIQDTDFARLRIYPKAYLNKKKHQINIVISYMENKPVDFLLVENCYIYPYERGRGVPCEYFYHFTWSLEELESMLQRIIKKIIGYAKASINDVEWYINRTSHPQEVLDSENSEDISFYEDMLERANHELASCNYSYGKTVDILKALSQSPCVDQLFVPTEKKLNAKSREEGIHFNTMLFGAHTDRMAIKFKSACE
ncbi:MAG: hypothetical protein OXB84_07460, partial [Halobacteriovoraceae bacterium]|nr:hypothetical protein [Halobacteriovoraceae bacterium]